VLQGPHIRSQSFGRPVCRLTANSHLSLHTTKGLTPALFLFPLLLQRSGDRLSCAMAPRRCAHPKVIARQIATLNQPVAQRRGNEGSSFCRRGVSSEHGLGETTTKFNARRPAYEAGRNAYAVEWVKLIHWLTRLAVLSRGLRLLPMFGIGRGDSWCCAVFWPLYGHGKKQTRRDSQCCEAFCRLAVGPGSAALLVGGGNEVPRYPP
jgi:hypothetical protein